MKLEHLFKLYEEERITYKYLPNNIFRKLLFKQYGLHVFNKKKHIKVLKFPIDDATCQSLIDNKELHFEIFHNHKEEQFLTFFEMCLYNRDFILEYSSDVNYAVYSDLLKKPWHSFLIDKSNIFGYLNNKNILGFVSILKNEKYKYESYLFRNNNLIYFQNPYESDQIMIPLYDGMDEKISNILKLKYPNYNAIRLVFGSIILKHNNALKVLYYIQKIIPQLNKLDIPKSIDDY